MPEYEYTLYRQGQCSFTDVSVNFCENRVLQAAAMHGTLTNLIRNNGSITIIMTLSSLITQFGFDVFTRRDLSVNAFLRISSILKQGVTLGGFIYLLFWYLETGFCYVTQTGPGPLYLALSVSTLSSGSHTSATARCAPVSCCGFQLKKLGSFVQAHPVHSIHARD